LIVWRSQDREFKRYLDYAFVAVAVGTLAAGIYAFANLGDEGAIVETFSPESLPTTIAPPATTTSTATTTTLAPTVVSRVPTTSAAPTTTVAPATTTRPVATTTAPPPVTVATTGPPTTPTDRAGPSIGPFRSSPSKLYECTVNPKLYVVISDPSGVASAQMFSTAMQREAGTNVWYLYGVPPGAVPKGQNSITIPVPIVARDNRGNSTSVTDDVTIYNCA
jgi:hypothetical protein